MKYIFPILSLVLAWGGQAKESTQVITSSPPMGCIISIDDGKRFCLKVGERSEYTLPDWIVGKRVYVNADPGAKVLLSDYNNLAYNRIGEFIGTVEEDNLKNVNSWNGERLDFDYPLSMRVTDTSVPVGCIVVVETKERYCLPVGVRSGYTLPSWIVGKTIYVDAAPGTKVLLSDWDNLSYNRIAAFTGTVHSDLLKDVKAWNGTLINFDTPRSMRVVKDRN